MSGTITPTRRKRAADLIASPAHRGNHGFTGASLPMWREQRHAILVCLRKIARDAHPKSDETDQATNATCPRFVGGGGGWGTDAGEKWVERATTLIWDVGGE